MLRWTPLTRCIEEGASVVPLVLNLWGLKLKFRILAFLRALEQTPNIILALYLSHSSHFSLPPDLRHAQWQWCPPNSPPSRHDGVSPLRRGGATNSLLDSYRSDESIPSIEGEGKSRGCDESRPTTDGDAWRRTTTPATNLMRTTAWWRGRRWTTAPLDSWMSTWVRRRRALCSMLSSRFFPRSSSSSSLL